MRSHRIYNVEKAMLTERDPNSPGLESFQKGPHRQVTVSAARAGTGHYTVPTQVITHVQPVRFFQVCCKTLGRRPHINLR